MIKLKLRRLKKLILKKEIKYLEGYLPTPRCRKLRYRDAIDTIDITIKEIKKEDAPIALKVTSYDDSVKDYLFWEDKLWTPMMQKGKQEGFMPLSDLQFCIRGCYDYWNYSKEEVINSYIKDAEEYIIIDGVVYEETGEPRYVSMTFGLGHNHGGTSLMIDNYYNPNISKDCYFNALEREKAISITKEIAINRGDTESVSRIGKSYNIEVLIPEAVKCNPQIEAGEGDPFLNKLNAVTELASSQEEAAVLSICTLMGELKK